MDDAQLERYSRHIMLGAVDLEGQKKLLNSKILIIGAGGLGSVCSMYLASSGVGEITIADSDIVSLSNLQRQITHGMSDIGVKKTESARQTLLEINPDLIINTVNEISAMNIDNHIKDVDAVIDCCDNLETRKIVNKSCVNNKKPLISAAVIKMEGQLGVFRGYGEKNACYECLYGGVEEGGGGCYENGVLAPVVGVMGTLQAVETIKVLLDIGQDINKMLMYDGWSMSFTKLDIEKNNLCNICKIK